MVTPVYLCFDSDLASSLFSVISNFGRSPFDKVITNRYKPNNLALSKRISAVRSVSFLLILVLVTSAFSVIYPQEKKIDPYELNLEELGKVVVTGSKKERLISSVTQKVDVINHQEINQIFCPKRNLSELIQYLPGASVQVLSRNDANWGAYGGIGPKYNTYLINGLSMDGFVDPMSLDKSIIQRIEVQRGPASVLYPNYLSQDFAGNQSPLAGTINLILKENISIPRTSLDLGYGIYNSYHIRVNHENNFDFLNLFAGISLDKSDYTNYGLRDSWLDMTDNPGYKKTKFYLGGVFFLDNLHQHKLLAFANRTLHDGDFGRPNRNYDNAYTLANFGYTGEFSDELSLALRTGLRLYNRSYENDNYTPQNQNFSLNSTDEIKQSIIPIDLSLSYTHLEGSNLTLGGNFQHASYLTANQPVNFGKVTGNDASAQYIGFFVQEELMIDKFTLRIGGRYSNISYEQDRVGGFEPGLRNQSWSSLIWSSGIKYRVSDDFTLFANAGNSFLTPSLKSSGGTLRLEDKLVPGKTGQLPNPDLKHEDGISIDLGSDLFLWSTLNLSGRIFYSSISDAIIEIVISQNPSQTMSINAGGTTLAQGFELSLKSSNNEFLSWFANLTVIDSKISSPDLPDEDNAEVPFVPPVTANAGFTLYLPHQINFHLWVHYSGKLYDSNSKITRLAFEPKEVINSRISKKVILNNLEFLVYLNLHNLSDNRFILPWQFRDTGFGYDLGIITSF